MRKAAVLVLLLLLVTGCGGPSTDTGEVVPISQVCSYEKWKTVAVEGYLSPDIMHCERASKGRRGIIWCTFRVYQTPDYAGASLSVQIPITSWLNGKNNHMEEPGNTGKNVQIYDNNGNLIPTGSKVRVFGELPKSDFCEFGLAKRIDRIS